MWLMKNFVTLVLILLLAGLGPVSGAIAHAHDVHSSHGAETVDHPSNPGAAVGAPALHHEGSALVDHPAPATFDIEQGTPADPGGNSFHIHTTVDGAPDGVASIKFLTAFAPVPRKLVNSDLATGPELPILQRPPRQIL